jgi:hypothetical protein
MVRGYQPPTQLNLIDVKSLLNTHTNYLLFYMGMKSISYKKSRIYIIYFSKQNTEGVWAYTMGNNRLREKCINIKIVIFINYYADLNKEQCGWDM